MRSRAGAAQATRRIVALAGACWLTLVLWPSASGSVDASAAATTGGANLTNITPSPPFSTVCRTAADAPSLECVSLEIQAFDEARARQHLPPLALDEAALAKMPPAEELLAMIDLERVGRGLKPIVGLSRALDVVAQRASEVNLAPSLQPSVLPGGVRVLAWSANWAGNLDAIGALYYWEYVDGYGYNVACTSPRSDGCWQDRANILKSVPSRSRACGKAGVELIVGAAVDPVAYDGGQSNDYLLAEVCGHVAGDLVVTWPQVARALGIATVAVAVSSQRLLAVSGKPISGWMDAYGGSGSYHWSAIGRLPPGLQLLSTGQMLGTPTQAGKWQLRVRVDDLRTHRMASGFVPLTVSQGPL